MQDTRDEVSKSGYWCTRDLGGRDLRALEEGCNLVTSAKSKSSGVKDRSQIERSAQRCVRGRDVNPISALRRKSS